MLSLRRIVGFIASALTTAATLGGGAPQPLWKMRLSERVIEPVGWTVAKGHPIGAIAFSPDGKEVAVTVDDHYQDGDHWTHLLIVDLQNPQGRVRQFDLEACGNFVDWAPDGKAILVCGRVLRLADGSSCDLLSERQQVGRVLSNRTYWLNSERVLRVDRTIADLSCNTVGKWEIDGNWFVAGTLPRKGLVLLGQLFDYTYNRHRFKFSDYAIANTRAHTLISGFLLNKPHESSHPILAEGAAVVCSTLITPGENKPVLRCWNLPGGEEIPLVPYILDYKITQASRDSARVIAERWGYNRVNLFKEVPDTLNFMVVELRSGQQIVSLKTRPQHSSSISGRDYYYRCSLSPNGEFLAEGGDGMLFLYRI